MTDTNTAEREALMNLADAYAEASFDQGLHQRTLDDAPEEARVKLEKALRNALAGRASLAASAGSEPVAYAVFAENGNIRVWATEPQHVKRIAAEQGLNLVKLYTHPSPPEGMAELALRQVLSVVQRYLPPDGPSAHDAMSEITAIVDPWPLGPLEKP